MYDAIVLGLGGVGSMALRGLARQGRGGRFLGIETHHLLHSYGSSHGKTRVYRRAYFEHANYVPWIEESIRVFREMENEDKDSFVQECGTIIVEQSQNPSSSDPQHLPPYCRASYESAMKHGIPVDYIDAETLKERYPQFQLDLDGMVGMLEPSGGFVRCEKVMAAALQEAKAASHVDIMEETRAISFDHVPSGDGKSIIELRVQTAEQREPVVIATKCLLVSMGAWTGQLFPSWAPYLRPIRQFQAFFQVDHQPELYGYPNMPTWVMVRPDYPLPHYGVPCDVDDTDSAGCNRWLKIGMHGRDDYIADPSQNRREVSPAERQEVFEAAQKFINLDRALVGGHDPATPDKALAHIMPCFYTMTKDAHFMLGTPQGHENVFCVAGLSGHGYKQAPALGQMMVDYALGKDMSKWNLDFCDPRRFGV